MAWLNIVVYWGMDLTVFMINLESKMVVILHLEKLSHNLLIYAKLGYQC